MADSFVFINVHVVFVDVHVTEEMADSGTRGCPGVAGLFFP